VGELARAWLSGLSAAATPALDGLADAAGVPLLSAFLFGLIGATSPCQLTTGAGAVAYVARGAADGRRAALTGAAAYALGKALVYALIGAAVLLAGRQAAPEAIPVAVAARKILGPAMLLLGLHMLGAVRLPRPAGHGLAGAIERRAGRGATGAFALGVAFSFADPAEQRRPPAPTGAPVVDGRAPEPVDPGGDGRQGGQVGVGVGEHRAPFHVRHRTPPCLFDASPPSRAARRATPDWRKAPAGLPSGRPWSCVSAWPRATAPPGRSPPA
jgi:hypothetical protein